MKDVDAAWAAYDDGSRSGVEEQAFRAGWIASDTDAVRRLRGLREWRDGDGGWDVFDALLDDEETGEASA